MGALSRYTRTPPASGCHHGVIAAGRRRWALRRRSAPGRIELARIAVTLAAVLCVSTLPVASASAGAADAQPLTWLKSGNYSALERHFTDLQRGFESGDVAEERLYQGFRALYEDGVDNQRYFDGWVQAYSQSYAARTARGAYYYRMGVVIRGEKVINATPPENIRAMIGFLARARPDLLASLQLTAKPYLSTLYLLNVEQYVGSIEDRRQWLDAGTAIYPDNTLLRLRYMNGLRPRWGGSLEMMRSFLAENERQHVSAPLLAKLDVIIHTEIAESFAQKGDFSRWDEVLKLAAATGEPPSDEALIGSARSAWNLHHQADADRTLQRLAQQGASEPWVLSQMVWIYVQERRMPEAWVVLQKAVALNQPWAQFSLGKTIFFGCADINLPANPRAGLVWIRRSADQGFAEASSFLLSIWVFCGSVVCLIAWFGWKLRRRLTHRG